MPFDPPALIPELDVLDLDRSLAVYQDVFGFACHVRRSEEGFVYLVGGGAHLMLQQAGGPGRRFHTGLERPLGRGLNLQIEVPDVDDLHRKVVTAGLSIVIALEERWYRHDAIELGNRQFVVADPDDYLLRFFTSLGERPASHPAGA